ncbi:unnamed protein product [Dicrocoelium dendriticum]|nr:unnamed protein product [Dicrocoelium dendriticum]
MTLPPNVLPSAGLIQSTVSKLAQESIKEVKRLRILLTRLLITLDVEPEDASDEDADTSYENGERSNLGSGRTHATSPVALPSDTKAVYSPLDLRGSALTCQYPRNEPLRLHDLVTQIGDTLETLDQLGLRLHSNRLNNRLGEMGLQNAVSAITMVDQLDFGGSIPTVNEYGEPLETESSEPDTRRVDWLINRTDAERWSSRYWERTHTVLEGLLTCSVFRRSHLRSDLNRHRLDYMTSSAKDIRTDLEQLLNDIHCSCPKLTITMTHSVSSVSVVHVRVGDVMQCFVTFRRIHPERVIVRAISERMLVKTNMLPSSVSDSSKSESGAVSKPVEEMLSFRSDYLGAPRDQLVSLLAPDVQRPSISSEMRSRRGGAPFQPTPRPVLISSVQMHQLDLVTPSRFTLFQRITFLAQCAILHFSNEYQPPSAMRGLFSWLHSYHDLFTAPCGRCKQLLGQDVSLPLWRSYPLLRKDDSRSVEPQHEHCQAIV